MCVIASAESKRLTEDMVEAMFDANDAGAGIAWRQDGVVKWEKGLKVEVIKAKCAEVPLPYIAHFRIPTCGGRLPHLCHPFPIDKNAGLELTGSTKGFVLFHNGHWGDWKRFSLDTAAKNGFKVPTGRWSDSRAMAWAAAHHGLGVLEFIDEKAITFGPQEIEIFGGQAGQHWALANGVLVSNKAWDWSSGSHSHVNMSGSVCMFGTCKKPRTGATRYCEDHPGGIQREVKALPPSSEEKKGGLGTPQSNVSILGARGGSSAQTPFREVARSGQVVEGKSTESEEVEEGEEGMGGMGSEGVRTQTRGSSKTSETLTPAQAETARWLAKINVKKYRSSGKSGDAHIH